jgi:hypothetical protein
VNKIAVIHYMPLEFYPPITNMLDIASMTHDFKIKVWSTNNNKDREIYKCDGLSSVDRTLFPKVDDPSIFRLIKYFIFNINCLIKLIFFRPDKILYYESYSAWPVYWYLKLFSNKAELLIHYHEYFTRDWYKNNMRLVKYYHTLEQKYLYSKATWISQTNSDRVELFLGDYPLITETKLKILPNYPPKSWNNFQQTKKAKNSSLRSVYIGSLSLSATYIKEYCEWVISLKGEIIFDIYAYNLHEDTVEFLTQINSPHINYFEGGVEYKNIPELLSQYDIGVILYKALSLNYKYNAPNKFFEYIACELSVWYPEQMLGLMPYQTETVLCLDFNKLEEFKPHSAAVTKSVKNKSYFAETILKDIIKQLKQK